MPAKTPTTPDSCAQQKIIELANPRLKEPKKQQLTTEDYQNNTRTQVSKSLSQIFFVTLSGQKTGVFESVKLTVAAMSGQKKPMVQLFASRVEAVNWYEQRTKKSLSYKAKEDTEVKTNGWNGKIKDCVEVFADGSLIRKGTAGTSQHSAGVGIYFGPGDPRNRAISIQGKETISSNQVEMLAIYHALQVTSKQKNIVIYSDSATALENILKMTKEYISNKFKFPEKSKHVDRDYLEQVFGELEMRWQHGKSVFLVKVKGHARIEGNEMADKLAKIGSKLLLC
ncbi:ribonuclease H-like domain-containing protein [Myxozyma melibiosi]|uniref:ribonuclease H n=1 Tax=Myxozyma melibiosi TaxID=54550 RepID=A0ABR1F195_9ASCO